MSFTKITTAGAGTMGSQVAWQMAFHGKDVTVYDAIPAGLEKGKALHREYAEHFIQQRGATQKQIDDTFARLTYTTDLAAAVRDAANGREFLARVAALGLAPRLLSGEEEALAAANASV